MTEPSTVVATVIPDELAETVQKYELAADGMASLTNTFRPHFLRYSELRAEALAVKPDAPNAARTARLALRANRVAADKARESLKADSLRRGKAIDGTYNVLDYGSRALEEQLEKIEKAEEIREQARKDALRDARVEELKPFADPTFYDLGNMPAAQWDQLIAGAKAAHELKVAAAAKAEAERLAAEKAAAEAKAAKEAKEAAEREALRLENERLAKVAAEERAAREEQERHAAAALAEGLAAERQAAALARAEQERAAAAERNEAEARRVEAAHIASVERQRLAVVEAELAAKAKAEADRIAAEKAAQEQEAQRKAEQERQAAAAPERQKLATLAATVRGMPVPTFTTTAGQALRAKIADQVEKMAKWIESEAAKL